MTDSNHEVLVVYETMFGNTAAVAEAIADGIREHRPVTIRSVSDVSPQEAMAAPMIVAGGPTHAFSLSRPASRAEAARSGAPLVVGEVGMREWLGALPHAQAGAAMATFDTHEASALGRVGAAAREAGRLGRERGYRLVGSTSFSVTTSQGPLDPGELERARAWGSALVDPSPGRVPSAGAGLSPAWRGERLSRRLRGLSAALVVVAACAAALTIWLPGVLTGPPVMNGSARGTAAVVLALAVPLLLTAIVSPTWSRQKAALWAGSVAYLLYNAVMFAFATPFNSLFLLYVAMLGLACWSLFGLLAEALPREPDAAAGAVSGRDRAVAGFVLVIVALNAATWLAAIVPASMAERPTAVLDGTGPTTNPVWVQDLAVWLPGLAAAAILLWRGHRWGRLATGAGLVFWTLEAVGVSVDQWFGHRADPGSELASLGAVWLFAGVAVLTALVTAVHLRPALTSVQARRPR